MKLLIHDLSSDEWEKVSGKYEGFEVVADDGSIKSCAGCFGCWLKDPGRCVIHDGYDDMGARIHRAEEVVVISRYTYGGLSPFVKNVFDRSIGYILPFFALRDGELHHKKRYPEEKTMTFIFRGKDLSAKQKDKARKYVEAVCRNFAGTIKDIQFEECEKEALAAPKEEISAKRSDKVLFLNCSPRGEQANSLKLLDRLSQSIEGETDRINLVSYQGKYDELAEALLPYERIVLGMPLYVDGIPSALLRLMEKLEMAGGSGKKIYAIANMGFYESAQIQNLLSMVREWAEKCSYEYCGGVAVGAGEMMGMVIRMPDPTKGPARNVALALDKLGSAINAGAAIEDIYADAYMFPRALYKMAAESGWPRAAKKNGLKKKDLYRQIT